MSPSDEPTFHLESRPDGGADYVCSCGKVYGSRMAWRNHFTKSHNPDIIKALRGYRNERILNQDANRHGGFRFSRSYLGHMKNGEG